MNDRTKFDIALANMFSSPKFSEYTFYGHILAQCKVKFDDNLPSLAGVSFNIDHYTLWVNLSKFNLIPFNPFPASGLTRSSAEKIKVFAGILSDAGIVTTIRKTRGDDIDAACGQLAGDVNDRTHVSDRIARQRTFVLKPAQMLNSKAKES